MTLKIINAFSDGRIKIQTTLQERTFSIINTSLRLEAQYRNIPMGFIPTTDHMHFDSIEEGNTEKEYGVTIPVHINDFPYTPYHSPKYASINGMVDVQIRCYYSMSEPTGATFGMKTDGTTYIKFNLENVMDSLALGNEEAVSEKYKRVWSNIRHEWGHFVQSFIFHPAQTKMNANADRDDLEYHTSPAELPTFLDTVLTDFEVKISDSEEWKTLSNHDRLKLVKSYMGMSSGPVTLSIGGRDIAIDGIDAHPFFLSYLTKNYAMYKSIVCKFMKSLYNSHLAYQ